MTESSEIEIRAWPSAMSINWGEGTSSQVEILENKLRYYSTGIGVFILIGEGGGSGLRDQRERRPTHWLLGTGVKLLMKHVAARIKGVGVLRCYVAAICVAEFE